ncbi:MAG: S-layer homology domain-containing protein [Oscillospiraceae bacterium]|nr:S-layer homology domain-containing protein [Oscillospiraceae bacterium]
MKIRSILLSLALCAALLLSAAYAAGGDAGDPLISLDYLQKIFTPAAESAVQEKLDASGKTVYDAAESIWRAAAASAEAAAGSQHTSAWAEACLKEGDILSVLTGSQVILLAGEAQFTGGVLVDVTDGTELASGGALKARHRYLAAEDTAALVKVSAPTAVLDYCGDYHISPSSDAPDCYAMATALRSLTLLRGTGSGFGEGFGLENGSNRVEALTMLLRLLGEEDDALECDAPQPFRDVPDWADRYVAYAYEKGYTNGVSATQFAPFMPLNAGMYVEFILRALGYSDTTQTDVSTSVSRAKNAGVLTAGEESALQGDRFLRSDLVYLSWYALEAPVSGSVQTLHAKLESTGVFAADAYRSAKSSVTSARR